MSPWDPVRDALLASSGTVQNGPTIPRNTTLLSTPPARHTPLLIPQNPTTHSPQSTTTPRASSLAMLLNDSTTYRSSLSPVMPSSRPPLPSTASTTTSPSVPLGLLMNPVSPSRKPIKIDHSPTLKRIVHPQSRSPPPMRPPTAIPYNPQRVSAPGSVLIPLTAAEQRTFETPSNSLRRAMALKNGGPKDNGSYSPSQPQASTSGGYSPSQPQTANEMDFEMQKKRKRSSEDDSERNRPTKRQNDRDDVLVAHHYNARPEVGLAARSESVIFGLKAFNNWVKSVLIQKMAHPSLARSPSKRTPARGGKPLSGRVLDIGCGKGGDLRKWHKARIRDYIGVDIATVSVNQARDRWEEMKGDRFDAWFAQLDCYQDLIARAVPEQYLADLFDVVSMQFCMHYAFETEHKVRVMLNNVSRYLRPGGRFVGTVPNADILRERLEDARSGDFPDDLSFGNSVYRVQFDSFDGPLYGHRYRFFLEDAVEDVPEYVVYWDNFVAVAEEYDLRLIYKKEFHNIYEDEEKDPEFGQLLKTMRVVDWKGESAMDEAQWDAANIYLAFAFEKQ